jgi:hypothetical protein
MFDEQERVERVRMIEIQLDALFVRELRIIFVVVVLLKDGNAARSRLRANELRAQSLRGIGRRVGGKREGFGDAAGDGCLARASPAADADDKWSVSRQLRIPP